MSVATIRARLALLQAAIPGVAKAYVQLPRGLVPTDNLPAFLNFVRKADYDHDTYGDYTVGVTRTFLMWLLVKPVAEGEEGEGEEIMEPWVETVAAYFNARPSLGGLIRVDSSTLVSDSGPKKMVWPGTPNAPTGVYWGAEFQLDITEIAPITYADNE
jgi:hypothetical protein